MRIRSSGAGRFTARRRSTLVAAATLVVAAASACSGTSPAPSHPSSSTDAGTYGSLPTFLPTPSMAADAPVTGSAGQPAVTSEGYAVIARLNGGTVRASVLGPIVPGQGLPKVQSATTATWTVTLDQASTTVPIQIADFVALDQHGNIYRPQLVPGAVRPPSTLRPGQRAEFQLRVVIATGEGVMRWQPEGHLLAVWDFVVEND